MSFSAMNLRLLNIDALSSTAFVYDCAEETVTP